MTEPRKCTAEEISEIEELDDLILVLYAYMENVDPAVRNAIRERVTYFFGIRP